jgi:hypothetical protein
MIETLQESIKMNSRLMAPQHLKRALVLLNELMCASGVVTREAAESLPRDGGGSACSKTSSSKCLSLRATP